MEPSDREKQMQEWEKTGGPATLLESKKKEKKSIVVPVVFGVIIAIAFYAVYQSKQPKNETTAAKPEELEPATRKAVEKVEMPKEAQQEAKKEEKPNQEDEELKKRLAAMEAQRKEQERRMLEARRKSALMAATSGQGGGSASSKPAEDAADKENSNLSFKSALTSGSVAVSHTGKLENLSYVIPQGKVIDAVVDPRVNSDLPGQICATVQTDVYGAQGREKLIVWGSLVCGSYRAEIRRGQDRIFVVWNRLVRPDGVTVALDSPGTDQLGSAGMGGIVDTHWAEIFGNAVLLSIIGAGSSTIGVGSGDESNSSTYYREQVQASASDTANTIMSSYANMPPTIKAPHGARAKIYVNRDLDFSSLFADETRSINDSEKVVFLP